MVNRDGSRRRGGIGLREKEREHHGRRLEDDVFTSRVCIDWKRLIDY